MAIVSVFCAVPASVTALLMAHYYFPQILHARLRIERGFRALVFCDDDEIII